MRRLRAHHRDDEPAARLFAGQPGNAWLAITGLTLILGGLLAVSALAWVPPSPDIACFEPDEAHAAATPAEAAALDDARNRYGDGCAGPWRRCAFRVATREDAIIVLIDAADVRQDDCLFLPGDGALYRYDLTGRYRDAATVL